MAISFKSIVLVAAVLLTGLSAGFFYAWSVSVIPGTKRVPDLVYLEAMQSINRAILNPAFYLVFFGSLALLLTSTLQHLGSGTTFWLMLAATLIYLIGTVGITGLGNVPLNNGLDILDLKELGTELLASTRQQYEIEWNRLHTLRTGFAVLAFLVSLLGIYARIKTS